jgi:transposase
MAKFRKEPVTTIGIDLAKNSVHAFGVDANGETVFSRKLSRGALSAFIAQQPPCRIAMEACGSAHHWARTFQGFGHEVVLIAPQFVKPFVKNNKTDAADAEAICEAAQRPRQRFVPIKSIEQQDIQAIHRMRSQVISQRTALVNQARGLLAEYGIVMPQGRAAAMRRLPEILEDAENRLSERFRAELHGLLEELRHLDARVTHDDTQIQSIADASESVQLLRTIPGVGPLVATALIATLGENWGLFANGRALAACLGLVPRQHSTGGKPRLLGISKRGDVYLRQLLIHGARAMMRWIEKKEDAVSH